jgi:hypothetical protein
MYFAFFKYFRFIYLFFWVWILPWYFQHYIESYNMLIRWLDITYWLEIILTGTERHNKASSSCSISSVNNTCILSFLAANTVKTIQQQCWNNEKKRMLFKIYNILSKSGLTQKNSVLGESPELLGVSWTHTWVGAV